MDEKGKDRNGAIYYKRDNKELDTTFFPTKRMNEFKNE